MCMDTHTFPETRLLVKPCNHNPSSKVMEQTAVQKRGSSSAALLIYKHQTGVLLVPVAHACNPSNMEDRDQKDCEYKPVWANSSRDPIFKNPNTKKRAEGLTRANQVVECLPSKHEALSSSPVSQIQKIKNARV
jgi:hypothetical protein